MRFVSSSLFLALLSLSCSSQPKDQIVPASLQETSAPVTAAAAAKPLEPACSDESFCTREYLPTVCKFSGETFEGSNPCEAQKQARRFACEKKLNFAPADVQCQPKDKKGNLK